MRADMSLVEPFRGDKERSVCSSSESRPLAFTARADNVRTEPVSSTPIYIPADPHPTQRASATCLLHAKVCPHGRNSSTTSMYSTNATSATMYSTRSTSRPASILQIANTRSESPACVNGPKRINQTLTDALYAARFSSSSLGYPCLLKEPAAKARPLAGSTCSSTP